ncbi:hypothetical protein K435DRAFT_664407 [Dendrothele bispora CBS 962.96]|uniref:Peptidase A2 domain-containing protein n=1 Tax=Dendrothele bispora (strain CBS 962.96) TaxID=1314807 RepID=A0A4S8M3I7_DENBC|nr:hypothetical protein K435DRAFT_664407 [Dendrothele bispora CBS 962.96]
MSTAGEFEVLLQDEGDLKAGLVVHRDITEQFRSDLESGDMEKIIIVASQTEGLRSVFPKINGKPEEIEVVLDSGSQIVSMSSSVASSLNLHWDPTRVIHMQSANGQLQPTKGLIRNVPFEFGGLTIYLQCHVIEKPPYQVLLGRPFDTLTESTIKNFPDGEQEVTITCPNTGNKMTVSTFPRGKLKRSDNVKPTLREEVPTGNFRTSRI